MKISFKEQLPRQLVMHMLANRQPFYHPDKERKAIAIPIMFDEIQEDVICMYIHVEAKEWCGCKLYKATPVDPVENLVLEF